MSDDDQNDYRLGNLYGADPELPDREPPMGEGTYRHICVECGFPFHSDDREACLCVPCEAEDAARFRDGWDWMAFPYRRFKRGE